MRTFGVLVATAIVAACEVPDDVKGEVVSFTETMVVIETHAAGYSPEDYKKAPSAMSAEAQRLCETQGKSAQFLNAGLGEQGQFDFTAPVVYRFACV